MKKPRIRIILVSVIVLIIIGLLAYFIATGEINFGADTTTPAVNNIVEGTYTSSTGSGQIEIDTVSIPVDMSQ